MINKKQFTYDDLLYNLENNINFTFSRFGDGEWNAILGSKKKHNCDKHTYFADMGEELANVLKSEPNYHIGLQSLAMRIRGDEIKAFLKGSKLNLCDADILHKANIKNRLQGFIDALKKRYTVVIGPNHLRKLNIGYDHFIQIRGKDCWLDTSYVLSKCARLCLNRTDIVFLFSGSMAANVWIDRLHNSFDENSYLDCGSLWEPYVGNSNRTYHKDILKRLNK